MHQEPDSTLATNLLLSIAPEDETSAERLTDLVGAELRAIASAYLRRERVDHTLQPTALVNEAYLRLIDSTCVGSSDRQRFMSLAARAMRRVLVDFARRRKADRRGHGNWLRVTLHPELIQGNNSDYDLVELNDLITKFGEIDERASRVVELRFFAGLSIEETADILGVTSRTVGSDWLVARTWLAREFSRGQST